MSAAVVRPVIPSPVTAAIQLATGHTLGAVALAREPLPLASLIAPRTAATVYGLCAVDGRGRVADRVIMRILGWSPGLRLAVSETAGVLTLATDPHGEFQVTPQGHLRLPAGLHRRFGLCGGDRVLLVVDPDRIRLRIYPPVTLDALLAAHRVPVRGGETPC